MAKNKLKELLIALSPSQMIYVSIVKELLQERSNRKFLLQVMKVSERSLFRGIYQEEAILGEAILSLRLNPGKKRYFKVFLTEEEYCYFWHLGKRLDLNIKREIFLGLLFIVEKSLQYNVREIVNRVISTLINSQNNLKSKEEKKDDK